MDDNTLKVSFPLGDSTEVTVRQPTDGQALVLSLTRMPSQADVKAQHRVIQRIMRVVESLVGKEQWENVIEEGLLDGSLSVIELLELVQSIVTFDWTLGVKNDPDPELTSLHRTPAPLPEVIPVRGPRVITGD